MQAPGLSTLPWFVDWADLLISLPAVFDCLKALGSGELHEDYRFRKCSGAGLV